MRIGLIGPVPPGWGGQTPGGVATHQVHLAEALAAAGADVVLLATNTRDSNAASPEAHQREGFAVYTMPDRLRLSGYGRFAHYVGRLGFVRRYGSRREMLRNVLAYGEFLQQTQPDVVHVQHPLERCTYARLVLGLERSSARLVVTAHSLFGEHAEDTIRNDMAPNLRAADHVIAVSEHIADQCFQVGVERQHVSVIRSGVDTRRFAPRDRGAARQRLNLSQTANIVLFVGNLEPRKQVDVLLRAIAQIQQDAAELLVLVVGSGENAGVQDQTARLLRLSQELGLEKVVRFTGRLPDEQLLDAYAAADVFALPSSSEAQGIVALEAMACGLSVVASGVGGLLGTIEDGETGFLVPPGDVDELAHQLVEVLQDSAVRQRVGTAARAFVEERFTWSKAAEATLGVYRAVTACA